jgi:hypothetical protein
MNGQGKNRLNRKQVCDDSEIESKIRVASRIANAHSALSDSQSPEELAFALHREIQPAFMSWSGNTWKCRTSVLNPN